MAKYRKKPVVIEATQWFKDGDHPAVTHSIHRGWGKVATLEGDMTVMPGDWIITGIKGEHYPCKPDIFEATYEPAGNVSTEAAQTNLPPYGYCPYCWAEGHTRERRPDGNDVCTKGHSYPSKSALKSL